MFGLIAFVGFGLTVFVVPSCAVPGGVELSNVVSLFFVPRFRVRVLVLVWVRCLCRGFCFDRSRGFCVRAFFGLSRLVLLLRQIRESPIMRNAHAFTPQGGGISARALGSLVLAGFTRL